MKRWKRVVGGVLAATMMVTVCGAGFSAAAADEPEPYQATYEEYIPKEMMTDVITYLNGMLETELWQKVIDNTVLNNYTIGMIYDFEFKGLASLNNESTTEVSVAKFKENLAAFEMMSGLTAPAALKSIPDTVTNVFAVQENGVPYLTTLDYGVTDSASFFDVLGDTLSLFALTYFGPADALGLGWTLESARDDIAACVDTINAIISRFLGAKTQFVMPEKGVDVPRAAADFIENLLAEIRSDTLGFLLKALPRLADEENLTLLATFLVPAYSNISLLLEGLVGSVDLGFTLPAIPENWVVTPADSAIPNPIKELIRPGVTDMDASNASPFVKVLSKIVAMLVVHISNGDSAISQIGMMLMRPSFFQGILSLLLLADMDADPNVTPQYCDKMLDLNAVLNTLLGEVALIPNGDGTSSPLGIHLEPIDFQNTLATMKGSDPEDILKVLLDYVWENVIVDEENYNALAKVEALSMITSLLPKTAEERAEMKQSLIPLAVNLFMGTNYPMPQEKPTGEPTTGDQGGKQEPTSEPDATDTTAPGGDSGSGGSVNTGDAAVGGVVLLTMISAAGVYLFSKKKK